MIKERITIKINPKEMNYITSINASVIFKVQDLYSKEFYHIRVSTSSNLYKIRWLSKTELTMTFFKAEPYGISRFIKSRNEITEIYGNGRKPSKTSMNELKEKYPEDFI